jgi:hypothetical protein
MLKSKHRFSDEEKLLLREVFSSKDPESAGELTDKVNDL